MKRFVVSAALVAIAVLAVPAMTGATASAANGGKSANADGCKQGGWQNATRGDGTKFKNQGDCISYAAKGGLLSTSPEPTMETYCKSLGGTFNDRDRIFAVDWDRITWTCNDWQSSMGTWRFQILYLFEICKPDHFEADRASGHPGNEFWFNTTCGVLE